MNKTTGYYNTRDIAKRFSISIRTIQRWMVRDKHPFPRPKLAHKGSQNRWSIDDVTEWENIGD